MKKILSAFYALAFTTTLAYVGEVEADTSVQFGIGYRSDDVNFKHKAPEEFAPATHSNLNFRDLEIFTVQGKIKGVCGDCVYYRVDGQYGWILDGTLRESDQFAVGFPAPGEVTIVDVVTHNDVKKNYVADFNIGIGYPLQQCWCPCLQIVPTIGFAYDTLRIRGHHRDHDSDHLTSAEIAAIPLDPTGHGHAKYRFTYWGPWAGFDLAFCHQDCWNLYGEFQFYFGTRARRERNSDIGADFFDSYRRTRSAWGFSGKIGSTYNFRCNWFADGYFTYKRFASDEHRDRLTWRSLGVGLDIGYLF